MSAPETKLTFTWYAWAKLKYACQKFDTEVSGFGVTSLENPLLVEDFVTVKQECTSAYTEMDDAGLADFFEDQIEKGLQPVQFGRIWIHTHPSGVNSPSGTDEATFEKVFGKCDWAVMFILTRSDVTYCALQFNKGPKARINIPVCVSYEQAYPEWTAELEKNVKPKSYASTQPYSNFCTPSYGPQGGMYQAYPEYGSYFSSEEYKKRAAAGMTAANTTPGNAPEEPKKEIFGAGGSNVDTHNSRAASYHNNRNYNAGTKEYEWKYGKRIYTQGKEGWVEKITPRYYSAAKEEEKVVEDQLANPVPNATKTVEQVITEADDTNIWSDMYGVD